MERLSVALFDAAVDLNPHQIEAALFALQSPLSKGVILADEVGLGKTIEAGIVLCQFWAERKRRLLVICPVSLRSKRQARQAATLEEQHAIQQQLQKLEQQQRRQRQDIFKAEDEIMEKRDSLIESLERRLAQHTATDVLFTIRWAVA